MEIISNASSHMFDSEHNYLKYEIHVTLNMLLFYTCYCFIINILALLLLGDHHSIEEKTNMHKQNDECNTTKKTNADSYVQQQRTKKVQILVISGHIF